MSTREARVNEGGACQNEQVTRPQPARPATSHDVARHAGLSRSTVSQVLNGYGERFSSETRDRVLSAASSLDYRPSAAGRALVTGVSDIIVLVLPPLALGPRLEEALNLISAGAAALGKHVLIRFTEPGSADVIDALMELRPAAVLDFGVLTSSHRDRLESAGIVLVPGPRSDTGRFDPTRMAGRTQAVELLRDPARRLVYALLGDGHSDPTALERLAGVRDVAHERGVDDPIVVAVPLNAEQARAVLAPLVGERPVGIACYNDDVAIAVLSAARDAGWAVPDSVAVVGVDATAVGQLVSPRLSTVTIHLERSIAGLLQDLREGLGAISEIGQLDGSPELVTLLRGETS